MALQIVFLKIVIMFLKFTVLINLLHHYLSIPSLAPGHLNYFPLFFAVTGKAAMNMLYTVLCASMRVSLAQFLKMDGLCGTIHASSPLLDVVKLSKLLHTIREYNSFISPTFLGITVCIIRVCMLWSHQESIIILIAYSLSKVEYFSYVHWPDKFPFL